ncbi:hypothetical protein ACFQ1S_34110 [Kibdelosporangium lantanae]|uniref:Transposase putative helix-turn-helix domain-containing protein n=1 Tax=Kibdelosporangium lantanae TaxID=1497396 RepID=A0ABW3MIG3_9PSEU
MKQVVQVRLLPTPEQASALSHTLHVCNAAASWLSEQMHTNRVLRKFEVQKLFYAATRERFNLAAQPVIRVISKVVDAYATLRANMLAGNYGPRDNRSTPDACRGRSGMARCPSGPRPDGCGGSGRSESPATWRFSCADRSGKPISYTGKAGGSCMRLWTSLTPR